MCLASRLVRPKVLMFRLSKESFLNLMVPYNTGLLLSMETSSYDRQPSKRGVITM